MVLLACTRTLFWLLQKPNILHVKPAERHACKQLIGFLPGHENSSYELTQF